MLFSFGSGCFLDELFGVVIKLLLFLFSIYWKLLQSSRQCVGLLDVRLEFNLQVRHQYENMKIFLLRLLLSRFLAKTLRVNKSAVKSFSKNLFFVVDLKLVYKTNAHNMNSVRRIGWTNYVCIYLSQGLLGFIVIHFDLYILHVQTTIFNYNRFFPYAFYMERIPFSPAVQQEVC